MLIRGADFASVGRVEMTLAYKGGMYMGQDVMRADIWRFPEMGVPPNHPFIDGFSIINPSFSILVCPHFDETSMCFAN